MLVKADKEGIQVIHGVIQKLLDREPLNIKEINAVACFLASIEEVVPKKKKGG